MDLPKGSSEEIALSGQPENGRDEGTPATTGLRRVRWPETPSSYWEAPQSPTGNDKAIARRPRNQPPSTDPGRSEAPQLSDASPSPALPSSHQSRTPRGARPKPQVQPAPPAPIHSTVFETSYTSVDQRDVTVHLEIDVIHDIGEELEEFNRYTRIGDFRTAKVFFQNRLKSHMQDPLVFVLYAEMLLQMCDYKSLSLLEPGPGFQPQASDPIPDRSNWQTLALNWRLTRAVGLTHSQFELSRVWDALGPRLDVFPISGEVNSTGIRALCLAIELTRRVGIPEAVAKHGVNHLADWADWKKIYRGLLDKGRIWDLHDVLVAAITYYSVEEALEAFLGPSGSVARLFNDWATSDLDESTQLALLDILSTLVLHSDMRLNDLPIAESYLVLADSISEALVRHFPNDVKSRPFLHWVVAKVSLSTRRGIDNTGPFDYIKDFPGAAAIPSTLGLPYYIPIQRENPGWAISSVHSRYSKPLEMALRVGRETEDYHIQSICIEQLIIRAQNPSVLFTELTDLFKMTMNMDGFLTTCFSHYLTSPSEQHKRQLLVELVCLGLWHEPVSPFRAAARDIIQHALSQADSSLQLNSISAGLKYLDSLPSWFQELILEYAPKGYSRRMTANTEVITSMENQIIKLEQDMKQHMRDKESYKAYIHDMERSLEAGGNIDANQNTQAVVRQTKIRKGKQRERMGVGTEPDQGIAAFPGPAPATTGGNTEFSQAWPSTTPRVQPFSLGRQSSSLRGTETLAEGNSPWRTSGFPKEFQSEAGGGAPVSQSTGMANDHNARWNTPPKGQVGSLGYHGRGSHDEYGDHPEPAETRSRVKQLEMSQGQGYDYANDIQESEGLDSGTNQSQDLHSNNKGFWRTTSQLRNPSGDTPNEFGSMEKGELAAFPTGHIISEDLDLAPNSPIAPLQSSDGDSKLRAGHDPASRTGDTSREANDPPSIHAVTVQDYPEEPAEQEFP